MRHLLCLLLLWLAAPALADAGSSAYAVGGIAVDVAGPNPEAARRAAWRIAQRRAWPILWNRLTGQPETAAPGLADGQIDAMVAGIESQGERFSQNRYIARLGVVFDRARASAWLAGRGGLLQSPPMLLLPVMIDGGAATVYEAPTPWRAAWQRYRENVTPIDYVMADGTPADNLLISAGQVHRAERAGWRLLLDHYGTRDVLTAEARLTRAYPGGPVTALFIARHGPDATVLGRFALRSSAAGLDAMLDQAVRRIDEIYAAALREGRLRADDSISGGLDPLVPLGADIGSPLAGDESSAMAASAIAIAVVTPDPASAAAAEALLRGLPGASGVVVTSLSIGGTTRLSVAHAGGEAGLAQALDARGWRLDPAGNERVLRRRRPGDAPLPPPVLPPPPATPPAPPPAQAPRPATQQTAPPARAPVDLLPRP